MAADQGLHFTLDLRFQVIALVLSVWKPRKKGFIYKDGLKKEIFLKSEEYLR